MLQEIKINKQKLKILNHCLSLPGKEVLEKYNFKSPLTWTAVFPDNVEVEISYIIENNEKYPYIERKLIKNGFVEKILKTTTADCFGGYWTFDKGDPSIDIVPTEDNWMPYELEEPDEIGHYFVTVLQTGYKLIWIMYFNGKEFSRPDDVFEGEDYEILAWQPMMEVYDEENN